MVHTAATVDAYYNPSMNDINFPAGILQAPLYDSRASDASNYGHIGGVVGHEFTHGFDDQGRQFDANGNLADWWTPEDGKKFDEKADCEVKEYGNFVAVDDVKVNGKLTLGENTADNGGLRLAISHFWLTQNEKTSTWTRSRMGTHRFNNSFWATDKAGVAVLVLNSFACRCKRILTHQGSFGRTAWCKICRSSVTLSAARPDNP